MAIDKDIPFAYRRDLSWDLTLTDNGDIKMANDIDAINQSIYSILVSNSGDKPLEELFGANFEDLIFENAAPREVMQYEIQDRLRSGLENSESQVVILQVEVDMSDITSYIIRIVVIYALGDGITTGIFDESLSLEDLNR